MTRWAMEDRVEIHSTERTPGPFGPEEEDSKEKAPVWCSIVMIAAGTEAKEGSKKKATDPTYWIRFNGNVELDYATTTFKWLEHGGVKLNPPKILRPTGAPLYPGRRATATKINVEDITARASV